MARRRSSTTKTAEQAAAKGRKAKTSSASRTRTTGTKRKTTRRRSTAKKSATPKAPVLPPKGDGERYYVLDIPYELRDLGKVYKARYVNGIGYVYAGTALPPGLAPFQSKDYSFERWTEDDLNKSVRPVAPSEHPMTPRPHQVTAIKKIIGSAKAGYRGFIEADDVGLGKTLACAFGAYGALQVKKGKNVLILCPKAVIDHWRNSLKSLPQTPGVRYCVINYDRAKKLLDPPKSALEAKRTRTKNSRTATHGTPSVQWDVIIADESHKLKNVTTSQRAKAFSNIARYAEKADTAPFVIWASATIGQNPGELGYLTPLISQLTKSSSSALKDWGKWLSDNNFHGEYSERFGKWEWTEDPKEREYDLQRINKLLFSSNSPSIRRLPTDVAGWPEMQRIIQPIDLNYQDMATYESLWTDFRNEMQLAPKGNDPKGLAVQIRFRQKASLLKVDATVEHVIDTLENGRKAVVSVEFIESLDFIREALEKKGYIVEEFSGQNESVREEARLRFQRGKADVMLFTVREAISLHAGEHLPDGTRADMTPRDTIIHDIPYSAFDVAQISGRAHRDGQFSLIYLMATRGTVEEKITKTVIDRLYSMKRITGDDVAFVEKLRTMMLGG